MLAMRMMAARIRGLGAWLRSARAVPSLAARPATAVRAPAPVPGAMPAPAAVTETTALDSAHARACERLWRLAFSAPSQAQSADSIHRRVRENIVAKLEVDALDPNYFPRRPTLMPQLLQAVNDPNAAAERVSRIIAHDPVLTADVLRMANSSLYRMTATPIETIQRAVVVCGADSLRGMLAAAMLRPVFRATRKNFPRLPRLLWERTERAARAAELYALEYFPHDRFEAQMVVLLSALGPLVVYSAALDVYARNPHFSPSAALCTELIGSLAPAMSLRIARDWETSPRLQAALEKSPDEPLTQALQVGEFLGTLQFLEAHAVISCDQRCEHLDEADIRESADRIWMGMA